MRNKNIIKAEDLYTPSEVAKLIGVSSTQVNRYAQKGFIDKYKDRTNLSKVYYLRSQVDQFLETRFYVEGN
ncbi:MAG: helix-turn-helix domain-containing protein [Cyanobacteria bacterium J06621_8]